jgi:hypothetical protein
MLRAVIFDVDGSDDRRRMAFITSLSAPDIARLEQASH